MFFSFYWPKNKCAIIKYNYNIGTFVKIINWFNYQANILTVM